MAGAGPFFWGVLPDHAEDSFNLGPQQISRTPRFERAIERNLPRSVGLQSLVYGSVQLVGNLEAIHMSVQSPMSRVEHIRAPAIGTRKSRASYGQVPRV